MSWIALAGSAAAVLAVAAVAWMLGLGGGGRLIADEAGARKLAEEALAGFDARRVWLSAGGDAALVEGDGDFALIRRHGAAYVTRRLVPPWPVRVERASVMVPTGDRWPRAVTIVLADAEAAHALVAVLATPRV